MSLQELSDLAKHLWPAWMMLVFLSIAFYAFRPRNKQMFEDYSRIPFQSDDEYEAKSGESLDHD